MSWYYFCCYNRSTWTCLKSNIKCLSRGNATVIRVSCAYLCVRGRGCFGSWQEKPTPRGNMGPRRTWLKIGNEQRNSRVRRFCYIRLLLVNCAASYRHFGTTYRSRLQFDSWPLKMGPEGGPETSVRRCVVYQKRAVHICFVAAVWNHVRLLLVHLQTFHQSSVMSCHPSTLRCWLRRSGFRFPSGVPRGGGVGRFQPPRNSEDPPKSCQTQPDCENC